MSLEHFDRYNRQVSVFRSPYKSIAIHKGEVRVMNEKEKGVPVNIVVKKAKQSLADELEAVDTKRTICLYPEQLLTVLDKGHFAHGHVPDYRYDIANPAMQRLIAAVQSNGPQPIRVWLEGEGVSAKVHVYSGNRLVTATRFVNEERLAEGLPAYAIECHVVRDSGAGAKSKAQIIELFGLANELPEKNDPLTRIKGAAMQVASGVPLKVAAELWNFKSAAQLRRCLSEDGILASEAVQKALSEGQINLAKALRIAELPDSHQESALSGTKVKTSGPSGISFAKLNEIAEHLKKGGHEDEDVYIFIQILQGKWNGDTTETEKEIIEILRTKIKPGRKKKESAPVDLNE